MRGRTGNTAVFKKAFKGLDLHALNMLRRVAERVSYPARTVLCREGEPADTFYLITTGRVAITRDIAGTDEQFVMGYLGPGQYFGEMAVITEEPRAATITTVTDVEALEISKEHFERIFKASPAMARSILDTLIAIVRETDRRAIEDLERRVREISQAYDELEEAQADRIQKAALEAQFQVAARAQRSLLPDELPRVRGFEFAAYFEPARLVSGDFYDVRRLPDGRVSVLLADVSDKGAHAALFMAVARTLFLTEARYHIEPRTVMHAVHRGLIESSAYEMFVTAIYGVLDPVTGEFTYVRGGHEEPLYVPRNGEYEFLSGPGRFLGLWPDPPPAFEERQVSLRLGDVLVLYSDGVTDMRNGAGEFFGRESVARLVSTLRTYDAERLANSIYHVVRQHRGPGESFDDFTLLVIKVV